MNANDGSSGTNRPAADRDLAELSSAARQLIDAAHGAAVTRHRHSLTVQRAIANNDDLFRIAQLRREADEQAHTALESYITTVMRSLETD